MGPLAVVKAMALSYRSSSYMEVIGSRSRSLEQKSAKFHIPGMQKTLMHGNKSSSIEERAVKYACSTKFSDTADQMV